MAADPARGVLIRRRAIRGALSNAVGQVIGLVALFVLTPYILARIGASGYGLWVLVGSLAAYGGLLDLGIGSAVVKYVAEHRARRDADASRALIATALRLYLALGALAFVLSLGVAAVFPDLFVAPADRQTASLLVVLTGLNLGISIAAAPTTSVLVGIQRFDLYNVVGAGSTLLWAATTVVALAAGAGVVGMVALNVPITLLMRVLSLRFIRQAAPDLPFGYAGASRAAAATVFGYSASIFASQISDLLQKKTDEIVVAAAIAVSAVTPYAIGRRLSEITHVLTNQFVRVLLPIASELYATNDRERLVTLYLVSTRVTITLFASIGLPIVLLAGQILTVWVGPGFEDAVPVIGILTAASFLLTSVWPAGSVLQGMARFRLVAISSVAS
ncbi:MAG TPA: oligosaccharide flippase family protein, partial [Candidatus Limnocylindrales bacterium]